MNYTCAHTGYTMTEEELREQVRQNPVCSRDCLNDPIAYDENGDPITILDVAGVLNIEIEIETID